MMGDVQEEEAWPSRASSEEQTASRDNRALHINPLLFSQTFIRTVSQGKVKGLKEE